MGERPRRRGSGTSGHLMLETFEALLQHRDVDARCRVRELHQCHLEQQARVGSVPHLDQHLAESFHAAHDGRSAETSRKVGDLGRALRWQLHQLGSHEREETVAKVPHDLLGEGARITTLLYRMRHHANARPGSASMNASTNSSSGVDSSATPPLAATSSSADTVSRAEPPP